MGTRAAAHRIGLFREGRSPEFKPVATLGFAADGGVFLAPRSLPDHGWNYANFLPAPDRNVLHGTNGATTAALPKLHYHRSGIIRVSLTGAELERREARFHPLDAVGRSQIMSMLCIRPWELPAAPGLRKGDIFWHVKRWPHALGMSLTLYLLPDDTVSRAVIEQLAPYGLLAGDPERFVVDLSAHGLPAILVARFRGQYDADRYEESGSSVVAMPWSVPGQRQEMFGLWSQALAYPPVWEEADAEIPPLEYFLA